MRDKDDNFGLIEITASLLKNKNLAAMFILSGAIIALLFTFSIQPTKSVRFSITYGPTLVDDDMMIKTKYIGELLTKSKLKNSTLPHLRNTRGEFIYKDVFIDKDLIRKNVKNSLNHDLKKILAGAKRNPVLNNSSPSRIFSSTKLLLLSQVIDDDYIELVDKSIAISFSDIKNVYPRPFFHSIVGGILGFLFFFLFIGLSFIYREAKKIN